MAKLGDKEQLVRALGDAHRIELIKGLLTKPQYVTELAKTVKLDRPTVSYNLVVLESAGILQSQYQILEQPRSKGRAARVYSVNLPRLREALKLLEPLQSASKSAST
jgi:predicted transcriptional regulator